MNYLDKACDDRKWASISGPGLAIAILIVISLVLQAKAGQLLQGHVPAAVSSISPAGRLPGTNRMSLTIGLPLRNRDELTNLLHQIYDQSDPLYRHYLSVGEFTERFGPTEQDYQSVISFMESHGLAVSRKHANRVLLNITGNVADIEQTLHTRLRVYPHPTESRTFYAPEIEPSLELTVPILHIGGLDNFSMPRPAGMKKSDAGWRPGVEPAGGSAPGGAYGNNDFRQAYAPGVTLTGAGQSVGLLEFDGYFTNDITAYETQAGLSNVTVTPVLVDNFNGAPGANNGEVALDIEMAIAMAPGLSQVIVYEGPSGSADDILNRMATDNLASQLSSSWLWGGGDDSMADQAFQEFAAQGQSFFNAAGDSGAYSASVTFPADNPLITIVGGTILTTSSNKSWTSETVWNVNNGKGGSGGISLQYLIPSWQQGIDMSSNQGSTNNRNLPDVAMVATNVWVMYNNGQGSGFIGTSCGAPLWAGFLALANQQASIYGQPPVGFLNPVIYAIGKSTNYGSCFHDITVGNNTNSGSPNRFFAAPGYDLCSGWGTPAGQPLIDALEPPDYLVISPATGFAAFGLPGGPFSPSSLTFTLTNHGPVNLNWSVGTTSIWLNLSAVSGTLTAGGPATQIAVNLNSAASGLASGFYTSIVFFTNQTTGIIRQRQFTLRVAPSLVQNGGFETGDFSDWNLSGNQFGNFVSSGSPIVPHSGNYAAAFGQAVSLGSLSQALSTTAGKTYLLAFWLENPNIGVPNQFVVNWNTNVTTTNTIFNRTNMGAFGWTNFQLLVTAAGTNSTLQFGFRNDRQIFGLDDISLTPLSLPVLQSFTSTAGTIALSWTAFPGVAYQLQYSTNLAVDGWQNLGNGMRATTNLMSATDSIGPDAQRFYRVILSP